MKEKIRGPEVSMCFGKWSGKKMYLGPLSFGLALGVTCGLAVFFWYIWAMYYATPAMLETWHMHAITWSNNINHSLLGLLKGFLFGFFVALFYDLFACCLRGLCKKPDGNGCGCDCGCGSSENKSNVKKR